MQISNDRHQNVGVIFSSFPIVIVQFTREQAAISSGFMLLHQAAINNADPESVQMLVDQRCVEYLMGLPSPKGLAYFR